MNLTLLLDLDNTLLSNDMGKFLPVYFKGLSARFPQWPGDVFIKKLLAATHGMVTKNQPDLTLEQAFDQVFYPSLGVKKEATPEDIVKLVCKYCNTKVADIKSKRKNNSVLIPRQIAMYSIRKVTNLSYPEIGRFFGGKDHSTVIHSIKKIESLLIKDQNIKKIVDSVTQGF